MNFGKRTIVAVDLNESTKENLKALRQLEFLKYGEIHFVYVYQTTNMAYGLGEFSLVYPVDPDRRSIEQSIAAALVKQTENCLPAGSEAKVIYRCLFDENPKEEFCLYANEVKADTIVVLTREKHGIFESSFAQYAVRHSKCNVVVLKP